MRSSGTNTPVESDLSPHSAGLFRIVGGGASDDLVNVWKFAAQFLLKNKAFLWKMKWMDKILRRCIFLFGIIGWDADFDLG